MTSLSKHAIPLMISAIGVGFSLFILGWQFQLSANARPDGGIMGTEAYSVGNFFKDVDSPFHSSHEMQRFASYADLKAYLDDVQAYFTRMAAENQRSLVKGAAGVSFERTTLPIPMNGEAMLSIGDPDGSAGDFNDRNQDPITYGTNIQVAGVDEADLLKHDGKFVYMVSGSRLVIVNAYPAENATIVSKVALDIPQGQTLQNMFLNGDSLVVFYLEYVQETIIPEYYYSPETVSVPKTHAVIINVSDRENPQIVKNYQIGGDYGSARMVGDTVYLLTSSGVDYQRPVMPSIIESTSGLTLTPDVYYFDNPEQHFTFNTVTAIDLDAIASVTDSDGPTKEDNIITSRTLMLGDGTAVYVSENNIFVAYQQNPLYENYQAYNRNKFYRVIVPLLPSDAQRQIASIEKDSSLDAVDKWARVSSVLSGTYDNMTEGQKTELFDEIQTGLAEYDAAIAKDSQKTIIHRISIRGGSMLEDVARGEVPGRLLNQFSMDESDGRFRVATTSEYSTPRQYVMNNNVYTLDERDMSIVGRLEGLAPNESIYAARFMADRLYLVTFQRTDPFFVIDMSKDEPRVLGKLKLPGFSDYLHPYDMDHIIGLGRETSENQWGGAETQGLKLALFDVSDVNNPKVIDTYAIGSSPNTDSEALREHKAFMLDKTSEILSIPISMPENDYVGPRAATTTRADDRDYYSGQSTWNGFYVFGTDPLSGFKLEARIDHSPVNNNNNNNYYSGQLGSRSFVIGSTLYTVTPELMKMNDLSDPGRAINSIDLGRNGDLIKYMDY